MKSNIVILDLDIYQKEVEAKAEALTKLEIQNKELEALNDKNKELEQKIEALSNEIEDLLDGIIKDDQTLYNDKLCSFNIKYSENIAEFLTEKGYLKLIKEIKERKEAKSNE